MRELGHPMRLVEASRLVPELDQMVAGVAGGDHKTAAETVVFGGDEKLDGSEPNRCNTKVYKDDELTRSTLVA